MERRYARIFDPHGDQDRLERKQHQQQGRQPEDSAREPSDEGEDEDDEGQVAEGVAPVTMRRKVAGGKPEDAQPGQEDLADDTSGEQPGCANEADPSVSPGHANLPHAHPATRAGFFGHRHLRPVPMSWEHRPERSGTGRRRSRISMLPA